MEVYLKGNKKYSFSPDIILKNPELNAYTFIKDKEFQLSLNKFYKCLYKLDDLLEKQKISLGLKRAIVNELFINSSIFFFINFFYSKNIRGKIKKVEISKNSDYLISFLKKYIHCKITKYDINNKIYYSRVQIFKQLNFTEIKYYIKKKIQNLKINNSIDRMIYIECPLIINSVDGTFNNTLFLREKINKQYKTSNDDFVVDKKFILAFNSFINSFNNKKVVKEVIEDIIKMTLKRYYSSYNNLSKVIDKFGIKKNSNFLSSLLYNFQDFALLDILKKKFNSKIITYQHGHGQGLTNYHDSIKFLKESSYSDINYVFSKNAQTYDRKNNIFSRSKTLISKYQTPYNKIFTKINYFKKNFDMIYFSPWQMNGTNHSLYNYAISDLEKIKIEKNLINNCLSKTDLKILIKKYPYDSQKYKKENYIYNLVSRYKNLTYYNKTLKYPEFYKKNQIILMFLCGSTFGYLASFHNPVILVNFKNYFPIKKSLKKHFDKSIFFIEYHDRNYLKKLSKLITNKNFLFKEWEKKSIYRKKFYKDYLGIVE